MKYLTICIDDGLEETYQNVMPIFQETKIKATWAVCPGLTTHKERRTINSQQINELISQGQDVQNHTMEHKSVYDDRERKGIGNIFIYPYGIGANDIKIWNELKLQFVAARSVHQGVDDLNDINWYSIKTHTVKRNNKYCNEQSLLKIMNEMKDNQWMTICFHLITNREETYDWSTNTNYLKNLIKGIPKDITIKTMSDVIAKNKVEKHYNNEDIVLKFKECIDIKHPITCLRVGDGENVVMALNDLFSKEYFLSMRNGAYKNWLTTQWRRYDWIIDDNKLLEYKNRMINAMKVVDFVGLLSYNDTLILDTEDHKRPMTDKWLLANNLKPRQTFDAAITRKLHKMDSFLSLLQNYKYGFIGNPNEINIIRSKYPNLAKNLVMLHSYQNTDSYINIKNKIKPITEKIDFIVAAIGIYKPSIIDIAEIFNCPVFDVGRTFLLLGTCK